MADDITFVFHKEWLNNIAGMPVEQQDKILADIIRYGTETKTQHDSDPQVKAYVGLLKERIDYSKNKYNQKVVMAKTAGRKKKIDDDEILKLARAGKNSKEIAEMLGYSKSAVDHSDGWKRRKEKSNEILQKFEF